MFRRRPTAVVSESERLSADSIGKLLKQPSQSVPDKTPLNPRTKPTNKLPALAKQKQK